MPEEIKNADLIRFVLDGGGVEFRYDDYSAGWHDLGAGSEAINRLCVWQDVQFRRKPERKPTVVRWIGVDKCGELRGLTCFPKPFGFPKALRFEYDPNDDTVKATVEEA